MEIYVGITPLNSKSITHLCRPSPVVWFVPPSGSEQLCGENTECIFDSIVVGLDEGAATLAAIQEFEAEVEAVGGGEQNQ